MSENHFDVEITNTIKYIFVRNPLTIYGGCDKILHENKKYTNKPIGFAYSEKYIKNSGK